MASTTQSTPLRGGSDGVGRECATLRGDGDGRECATPEVFTVTWQPDDHISELASILQGSMADRVERVLVEYVEERIEPAGWRAVWSLPSTPSAPPPSMHYDPSVHPLSLPSDPKVQPPPISLCTAVDLLVDVVNVSHEKLLADVTIVGPVKEPNNPDDVTTIQKAKGTMMCVPLMQLFPIADQENPHIDLDTTTEVVEQVRFFYEHIWQAWDLEEESLCYTTSLIAARFKLYQDIVTGVIPAAMGSEIRSLVRSAEAIHKEIQCVEAVVEESEAEVDERHVARLIHLHRHMDRLKARHDALQDPVLRMLSRDEQVMDWPRSHGGPGGKGSQVKVVMDALAIVDVVEQMAKLLALVTDLVQGTPTCQGFPTLQMALEEAVRGDVIALCDGSHRLHHLGLLSYGGTIIGLGQRAVIEGMEGSDILIDTHGDFLLQNVVLRPASGQVGLVQHKGKVILKEVKVEGGKDGIQAIGATVAEMTGVTLEGCQRTGLTLTEKTTVHLTQCTIERCGVGLRFEDQAKVKLSSSMIRDNTSCGIQVVWPEGSDVSRFESIPMEGLLACLFQECEENAIEKNGQDVAVVAEVAAANNSNSPSHFKGLRHHPSSGSMDSGCDFLDNVN